MSPGWSAQDVAALVAALTALVTAFTTLYRAVRGKNGSNNGKQPPPTAQ